MKQPNTLPELLRHAADLAEKGGSLAGKFEIFDDYHRKWMPQSCSFDFTINKWRIADAEAYAEAKLARDKFEIGEFK